MFIFIITNSVCSLETQHRELYVNKFDVLKLLLGVDILYLILTTGTRHVYKQNRAAHDDDDGKNLHRF